MVCQRIIIFWRTWIYHGWGQSVFLWLLNNIYAMCHRRLPKICYVKLLHLSPAKVEVTGVWHSTLLWSTHSFFSPKMNPLDESITALCSFQCSHVDIKSDRILEVSCQRYDEVVISSISSTDQDLYSRTYHYISLNKINARIGYTLQNTSVWFASSFKSSFRYSTITCFIHSSNWIWYRQCIYLI